MLTILFIIGVVALGLAGWNFYAVLDDLRRSLTKQFTEEELRLAVGYHMWSPLLSDAARRRYIWSHLWGSAGILSISTILWLSDHLIGAAVAGGFAVATTAATATRCKRRKLQ